MLLVAMPGAPSSVLVPSRNAPFLQRLQYLQASMEAVKLQLTTHMASISTSQSIRLSASLGKSKVVELVILHLCSFVEKCRLEAIGHCY